MPFYSFPLSFCIHLTHNSFKPPSGKRPTALLRASPCIDQPRATTASCCIQVWKSEAGKLPLLSSSSQPRSMPPLPRWLKALHGAALLYTTTLLSSRVSSLFLLWGGVSLAALIRTHGADLVPRLEAAKVRDTHLPTCRGHPSALPSHLLTSLYRQYLFSFCNGCAALTLRLSSPLILASHISPILLHQALVSAKAVDLNVLLEEKCPKKFLFPLLTLLWATFSSYTTLALTMAVGCIGIQVPKRLFSRRVG